MSLKLFIAGIAATTIIALASFLAIIILFSPENADATILALIFLSLFLGAVGFFSLFGFYVRGRKKKSQNVFKIVGASFRQGALLSFLLVGSLFLRTFRIGWWANLILLFLVLAIEILSTRNE